LVASSVTTLELRRLTPHPASPIANTVKHELRNQPSRKLAIAMILAENKDSVEHNRTDHSPYSPEQSK
jgi:hypothetical protein